mgnify:CR=1 FL=1
MAMASSTDVIGPFARTAAEAALVLDVMAGKDELDGTTIQRDVRSYTDAELSLTELKVGVIKEYMNENLDPKIAARVNQSVEALRNAGVTVEEVSLPSLPLALAVYYIICPAEVSSNLSRYDGQRYQHAAADTKDLDESYTKSRSLGFGNEAKRRIMIGTYVLSSGFYDAYYQKAQLVRTKLINEYKDVFKKVDFLIGPVSPSMPFKIGEKSDDPLQMYLSDVMMPPSNLVGNASVSVPTGLIDGLPVGVQLIADQGDDRRLLALAGKLQEMVS